MSYKRETWSQDLGLGSLVPNAVFLTTSFFIFSTKMTFQGSTTDGKICSCFADFLSSTDIFNPSQPKDPQKTLESAQPGRGPQGCLSVLVMFPWLSFLVRNPVRHLVLVFFLE
jgi:hypothetical protein